MDTRYFRLIQNSRGISLVELLVALGVMALVSVGVATGVSGLMSKQKAITQRLDGNEFIGSLSRSLNEKSTCADYARNQQVPVDWTPLTIPNYRGYGSRPGEALRAGYVLAGTVQNPQLQVTALNWRAKPNMSYQMFGTAAGTFAKAIVQVQVGLQVMDQGRMQTLPPRELEFAVVVNPANRLVYDCEAEAQMQDICGNIVGAKYDPAKGSCFSSQAGCEMKGSYVHSTCKGATPCRATKDAPPRVNEYTKGYSCPAGFDPMSTFNYTWTSNEQVGKKSFVKVQNTIQAYVCMKCNVD